MAAALPRELKLSEVACPCCGCNDCLVAQVTTPSVHCTRCNVKRCAFCWNMWTADHRCKEATHMAKRWKDFKNSCDTFLTYWPMGIKRCPNCRVPFEKEDPDSCDHIFCHRCDHEFCWECGEDRKVILAHGNHFHHPQCRHFFEFEETPQLRSDCPVCQATGKPCVPATIKYAKVVAQRKVQQQLYTQWQNFVPSFDMSKLFDMASWDPLANCKMVRKDERDAASSRAR
eukprot:TRINITY_DN78192_c0_g1_i1.p1 TRINITY_DN78192_c0_g1~~TRINITY_DN78192_c0_g1_i1.p1  ORF type:complete len:229 (+),score=45.11 TRINITY_DN78192_c0_g1_i1:62-748(+)